MRLVPFLLSIFRLLPLDNWSFTGLNFYSPKGRCLAADTRSTADCRGRHHPGTGKQQLKFLLRTENQDLPVVPAQMINAL